MALPSQPPSIVRFRSSSGRSFARRLQHVLAAHAHEAAARLPAPRERAVGAEECLRRGGEYCGCVSKDRGAWAAWRSRPFAWPFFTSSSTTSTAVSYALGSELP